jgi:hypothetical protein
MGPHLSGIRCWAPSQQFCALTSQQVVLCFYRFFQGAFYQHIQIIRIIPINKTLGNNQERYQE